MNLDALPLPIRTSRLLLRPFSAADLPAYAAYHLRPDVYRFLYRPVPTQEQLTETFSSLLCAPFAADGDRLRLAVVRDEDAALVGEVHLGLADKAALQAEVGYIFNPDFAGKGYATEATNAMLGFGFDTVGCHRIFARLDALNAGSVGLLERLGMRREAHLVQNDRFDGVWGDELIYAMLKHEWTRASRA